MTGIRNRADGGHAANMQYWGDLYFQIIGPRQIVSTYIQQIMLPPKFPVPAQSTYSILKERVNEYFKQQHIKPSGNVQLFVKSAILVVAFLSVYVHLLFFTPSNAWAIAECMLLGLLTASIGFNVMHDGAHGSYSTSQQLNTVAAYSLDILGASSFMWNTKHNVIHHAYTNIDGLDDDIDAGIMLRMNTQQRYYPMHKYQYLYFWLLYALLYVSWVFYADYKKYFRRKVGAITLKKMSVKDHILFWGFKLLHLVTFILLPIYLLGFVKWIIGFVIYTSVTGFILSIVFQLAHVVEETAFPVAVLPPGKMEDEWALHQLKTTANFATRNKFITWWAGGLNFQVEHHLFPRISHIHYPAISKIVSKTCRELGIPYLEHRTFGQAIRSHISYLKLMGNKQQSLSA